MSTPGIEIKWDLKPEDPSYVARGDGPGRLYHPDIPHVLLKDRCGNTLWMRRGETGNALFELFGMQGGLAHYVPAFASIGWTLIETITGLPWTDSPTCGKCQP